MALRSEVDGRKGHLFVKQLPDKPILCNAFAVRPSSGLSTVCWLCSCQTTENGASPRLSEQCNVEHQETETFIGIQVGTSKLLPPSISTLDSSVDLKKETKKTQKDQKCHKFLLLSYTVVFPTNHNTDSHGELRPWLSFCTSSVLLFSKQSLHVPSMWVQNSCTNSFTSVRSDYFHWGGSTTSEALLFHFPPFQGRWSLAAIPGKALLIDLNYLRLSFLFLI